MSPEKEAQIVEKVELLDGSRSGKRSGGRAAVRVDDLKAMMQIKDRLQAAKAAGTTPTKAEFDALVEDVDFMRARLYEIMVALRGKLL